MRERNKAGHYHAIVFGILVPNIILVQSQQGTFPECQSPMGPLSYHLCTTIPLLSLAPPHFSSFPLLLLAPASFPYFCLLAESEAVRYRQDGDMTHQTHSSRRKGNMIGRLELWRYMQRDWSRIVLRLLKAFWLGFGLHCGGNVIA